ncbi:MAG TPA: hypothetical protein VLH39_06295 [Magnetospirillaceae bacterium]|nr:hypothetical protein [Magnetospirillaceae bacterium]
MKTKEYVMHLLAEISSYILDAKPMRMVISLHQEEDGLHLSVMDTTVRKDSELEAIGRALNTAARPEMADYYGHMAGNDLVGVARLNLIGWQVKKADVERIEEGTKIDLWLGSDRFDSQRFTLDKRG